MTCQPYHANSTNTATACFECGQTGHLHASCLHLKQNVRSMAVRADSIGVPEKEPPIEDLHPQDEGGGGWRADMPGEWDLEPSQYHWDEEEEEETDNHTVTYRSNVIQIASDEHTATKIMAACTKMTASNKAVEPMYHHRSKYRLRPKQPRSENSTLSGYWKINGVWAHCLLDSGRKGVMLSPEFIWATGTKTFTLDQLITLQLVVDQWSTMEPTWPLNLVIGMLRNTSTLLTSNIMTQYLAHPSWESGHSPGL